MGDLGVFHIWHHSLRVEGVDTFVTMCQKWGGGSIYRDVKKVFG